jgi:hypothetical protein
MTVSISEPIRTESRYYTTPDIGVETTAFIGDSLIKEGRTSAQNAIFLNNNHGTRGWTAFHPAGIYKLVGKTNGSMIYQFDSLQYTGVGYRYPKIIENPDGNVYLRVIIGRKLLDSSEYAKRQYVEESGDDFEQTLIYTGKDGNVLRFTYREFVNDMARSSFTIDALYDIKDDATIRFRGAVLEIISTDNQSITYRLLSGFKSNL